MTESHIIVLVINAGALWIAYELIHALTQDRREQREHEQTMWKLKNGESHDAQHHD